MADGRRSSVGGDRGRSPSSLGKGQRQRRLELCLFVVLLRDFILLVRVDLRQRAKSLRVCSVEDASLLALVVIFVLLVEAGASIAWPSCHAAAREPLILRAQWIFDRWQRSSQLLLAAGRAYVAPNTARLL